MNLIDINNHKILDNLKIEIFLLKGEKLCCSLFFLYSFIIYKIIFFILVLLKGTNYKDKTLNHVLNIMAHSFSESMLYSVISKRGTVQDRILSITQKKRTTPFHLMNT